MAAKVKSYEELRAERQQEWEAKQALRAKLLGDLHAMLTQMPDVRNAPAPDLPWSHPDISCPTDGGKEFRGERLGPGNGVRHPPRLPCLGDDTVATWDWATMHWMV